MTVDEVTKAFEMEPRNHFEAGQGKLHGQMAWNYSSWTEGERFFFREIHEVLVWLEELGDFVPNLVATGGEVMVVAQLPGLINIGDVLKQETMALAVKMGVLIGVEVFPKLSK